MRKGSKGRGIPGKVGGGRHGGRKVGSSGARSIGGNVKGGISSKQVKSAHNRKHIHNSKIISSMRKN